MKIRWEDSLTKPRTHLAYLGRELVADVSYSAVNQAWLCNFRRVLKTVHSQLFNSREEARRFVEEHFAGANEVMGAQITWVMQYEGTRSQAIS